MNRTIAISLFLMYTFFGLLLSCSPVRTHDIRNGMLDLTDSMTSGSAEPIKLDGEWAYYHREFLDVGAPDQEESPDSYLEVPGAWSNAKLDGKPLSPYGFGSFQLRIHLPPRSAESKLALYIPEIFSSYRLYINGDRRASAGKPGKNRTSEVPAYGTRVVDLPVKSDSVVITLHVSNHVERRGGIFRSILLGPRDALVHRQQRNLGWDFLLFGALFIMGLYHLGLYMMRRKDASPLFLGLFLLILSLRSLLYGERFLYTLGSGELYWLLLNKADHMTFYLGFPLFLEFIHRLFPDHIHKTVTRVYQAGGALAALMLFFPIQVYHSTVIGYEVLSALLGLYMIFQLVGAYRQKIEGAGIVLLGLGLFFLTGINEILYNNDIVQTGNYLNLGLFLFIFSQTILLALRFSRAFQAVEQKTRELDETSRAYYRFVPRQFLEFLARHNIRDVQLGDQVEKEMTILFADIRNFTTISESMSPAENFQFINSLLQRIGPVIRQNGGFIDKFIGDAIMSLFPGDPADSIRAALAIQEEVNRINQEQTGVYGDLRVGIGIHTGYLMLGTVGESERMESTVISDAVNLASRLEQLTREYSVDIVISSELKEKIGSARSASWEYRHLGMVYVKGKKQSIDIYTVE